MKKTILALSLLLITQLTYGITTKEPGVITKDDIMRDIVSLHNAAFGNDNIYAKQIAPNDISKWNNAIAGAKRFVEAHSSNNLGIKDKDLINPLIVIEKANMDLVNAIKVIYASRQSPTAVQQNIAALETIKNNMIQVQSKLKSALFVLNKEQKTMARDILVNIAMFIETTAAKAIRDVARI